MNKKEMYFAPRIKTLGIATEGNIALSLPVNPGDEPVDPSQAEAPRFGDGTYDAWDSSSFDKGLNGSNSNVWDD